MSVSVVVLILASVTLSASAQIALKHGMSAPAVQRALAVGAQQAVSAVVGGPFVWLGLALYGLGAVLWLGVLARVDVGQAYPFVGLGFLLTMMFGVLFLGEILSTPRLLGTLLVVVGVIFVARG